MSRAAYEIRVSGKVPPRMLEDFEKVTISVALNETTVRAELADDAELQGILDALHRCGVVLLDIRREQNYD